MKKDAFTILLIIAGLLFSPAMIRADDLSYLDQIKVECDSRADCLGMAKLLLPVARKAAANFEHGRAAVYSVQVSQYLLRAAEYATDAAEKAELVGMASETQTVNQAARQEAEKAMLATAERKVEP